MNNRSIINIYLAGGPSHIDTWDLKPNAPPEIRGEFHPIPTTVPGMEICHLMPKLASIATKFSIVRSLTGIRDEHAVDQTESGWSENDLRSVGGHPSLGCVVAKLQGATRGAVPTFVDLTGHTKHGFLGPVYSGFRPDGEGRSNLRLRNEITPDRFHSRAELLAKLDHIRRDMDSSHAMDAMDAFNQRAYGVIASPKLAEALEWEKTDAKIRERYGAIEHQENSRFIVAKRLVECGVRIVSFSWGGWDTHGDNFNSLRRMLPPLDVGLSAMIDDLESSGLAAIDDGRDVGRIRSHPAGESAGGPRPLGRRRQRLRHRRRAEDGASDRLDQSLCRNGPRPARASSRDVRHLLSAVGHRPEEHRRSAIQTAGRSI